MRNRPDGPCSLIVPLGGVLRAGELRGPGAGLSGRSQPGSASIPEANAQCCGWQCESCRSSNPRVRDSRIGRAAPLCPRCRFFAKKKTATAEGTRRSAGSSGGRRELLDGPAVAVGIAEGDEPWSAERMQVVVDDIEAARTVRTGNSGSLRLRRRRREAGGSYFQETHPQELFRECSVYAELVSVPEQLPRVLEIAMRHAIERSGVAVVVVPGEIFLARAGMTRARP